MNRDVVQMLEKAGVQPSPQRVAVAEYVLFTQEHPSADLVWSRVTERFPLVSRATVYNTLNRFVELGLLRELILSEGKVVFDPNVTPHHHFIDEQSGAIHDVPWDAVQVSHIERLKGYDVREYQVVMRGRRSSSSKKQQ